MANIRIGTASAHSEYRSLQIIQARDIWAGDASCSAATARISSNSSRFCSMASSVNWGMTIRKSLPSAAKLEVSAYVPAGSPLAIGLNETSPTPIPRGRRTAPRSCKPSSSGGSALPRRGRPHERDVLVSALSHAGHLGEHIVLGADALYALAVLLHRIPAKLVIEPCAFVLVAVSGVTRQSLILHSPSTTGIPLDRCRRSRGRKGYRLR